MMTVQTNSWQSAAAPFGVRCKRFNKVGFHPGLDPAGTLRKGPDEVGPGHYDPVLYECAYKKYNISGSSWARKAAMEEFSQNLGYRNTALLETRRVMKTLCGPGTYDVDENVFKKKSCSVAEDIGFGAERRFRSVVKQDYPPPGTYSTKIMKMPKKRHDQMTPVPCFEWDGFVDRFKGSSKPWSKPPNLYNPKDGTTIAQQIQKHATKRGRYDCFTGPRDNSTIKNHFATPKFRSPDVVYSWPYDLEILLNHPTKSRCGKFLQAERSPKKPILRHMIKDLTLCYRDPDEPGPASYTIEKPKDEVCQNKHPFNMSVAYARPPTRWTVQPGPGRYSTKHPSCDNKGKRQTWIFRSKSGRALYKPIEYNSF